MCDISVNWEMILKYIIVFLSWPFIALVIIVFICSKFKGPISNWLVNLKVQYGDAIISSSQSVEPVRSGVLQETQSKPKDGPTLYLESISTNDSNELKRMIINWRENAYIWEYKYLNFFLVPHTKEVLYWLYNTTSSRFETYNNIFSGKIPDLAERTAVIKALESHFMIKPIENGVLEISDKGKEYTEVMLAPILSKPD